MKPALGMVLAVSALFAQQASKLPSEITAAPRFISLTVVPLDSHGQFVPGLRAEDFQVSDDGKPQKIVGFQTVSGADRSLQNPLPPNVYSNRGAADISTVILFDLYNQELSERGRSADQIVQTIQHLESPGNTYLYLLTGAAELYPVHAIPAATDAGASDSGWPQQVKPLLDDALRKVPNFKNAGVKIAFYRIGPTWTALDKLASSMATMPGRKNFIWITSGVPNGFLTVGRTEGFDLAPLKTLADEFNWMNAAAYAVQEIPAGMIASDTKGSEKDTLLQLTGLTGGRFYDSDKIQAALTEAIRDSQNNYRIVYIPPANDWNNKYHKIRVTAPAEDPRILTIQTKQGHYAAPEDPPKPDGEYAAAFSAATRDAPDRPDIGVRVTVVPDDTNPKASRFQVLVDPSDVLFLHEDGRYKAQLVLTFIAFTGDGKVAALPPMPLALNLTPDAYQKTMKDGILMNKPLIANNRVSKVRVLVLDTTANVSGSVTAAPDSQ